MSADSFPEGFNPFGGSGEPAEEEGLRHCLQCDTEYYWPGDGTFRRFCSIQCWWKY